MHRHAEVDSELIFRLASRLTGEDGRIDLDRLISKITRFRGQMSAVVVSLRAPGTILVLKGDKPLSLWLHPKRRAGAYASEASHLMVALTGDPGWRPLDIPPMTIIVLDHEAIAALDTSPFHFTIQKRRTAIPQGVSA